MSTTIKPLPQALAAHELAELLPDMAEGELKLLVESITKIGQQNPIVLLDGKILDGRSRYAACIQAGIPPITRNYDVERDGTSPTEWVLAQNVNRRHLSTSQRAMIYQRALPHLEKEAEERVKAAQFKAADAETPAAPETGKKGRSSEIAAKQAKVSPKSIERAAKVAKEHPDLAAKVEKGEISLNEAVELAEQRAAEAPATSERDDIAKEHFEDMKKVLGEDFAISVRDGVNLKSQDELEAFLTLGNEEQRSIKELVSRKWKVAAAIKWIGQEVDREAKLKDLFLRTLSAGGKKGTWTVDGWNVTVARAK